MFYLILMAETTTNDPCVRLVLSNSRIICFSFNLKDVNLSIYLSINYNIKSKLKIVYYAVQCVIQYPI